MIKCFYEIHPNTLLSLLNLTLKGGKISKWAKALLIPIFKSGDEENPNNYRGIALLPCLSKLFYTLLNNRLISFCIGKKL